MELISVASAKVVWLLNTADLNPNGLSILRDLIDALAEEYDFDEPDSDAAKGTNGVKLKNGEFLKEEKPFRVALEMYDDGFVAESAHSTALTEEFLTHAIAWAKETFSLKFEPSLVMNKLYFSDVVVKLSSPLTTASNAFTKFADLLNHSGQSMAGDGFMVSALTFSPIVQPVGNPKNIVIERRANTPANANIFYCKAPMTTDELIAALNKFDDFLMEP